MRCIATIFAVLIAGLGTQTRAQDIELPKWKACPVVAPEPHSEPYPQNWGTCEKWAWSCIRRGQEVNLFAKECVVPRSDTSYDLRYRYKYAPFYNPDRYKTLNEIDVGFLYEILSEERYKRQVKPIGVRILGAYFREAVNLENVATTHNLVLDQSIFKAGLRLTNFTTSKNLSLDGSNVRGRIKLLRAKIAGTLFMEEGVYDLIDATDARFGASIDAPASIFNGPFRLDRVRVEGKVSFIRTRLTEFTAWDTTISSKLELRYAGVRGRIDLTGTTVHGDLRMQRVKFGRSLPDDASLYCDWDLHDRGRDKDRFFLSPDMARLRPHHKMYQDILHETILSRPSDAKDDYPCIKIPNKKSVKSSVPKATHHEVLLRDMKIGGALCLIGLSGEIISAGPKSKSRRDHISSIALDGTQSRSTIIRWPESDSLTLWQGVHFKTENLFIDLSSQPQRHFFDNLKIGNVSFIRPSAVEVGEQTEESRAFLCDIRPGPGGRFASDSPETHERIVRFFTNEANEAKSPQPFGEIVARLNDSNSASLMLKMALSEYTYSKACSSSQFFKPSSSIGLNTAGQQSGAKSQQDAGQVGAEIKSVSSNVEEARRVVVDGVCRAGVTAFKYSVAYGHQPFNIVLVMAIFVALFRMMLSFENMDREPTGNLGRRPKLGLLYSIDMFTPFVTLDPKHSQHSLHRKSLKTYLVFHRVIGLVLTGLLIVAFYAARL